VADGQAAVNEALQSGDGMPGVDVSNMFSCFDEKFIGLSKILFGFMQVVSTLAVTLPSVPWPTELTEVWKAVGLLANIDFLKGINMDCITSSFTFLDTFTVTIIYPIGFLILIVGVTYLRMQSSSASVMEISNEGWQASLFLLFLVYPSVSAPCPPLVITSQLGHLCHTFTGKSLVNRMGGECHRAQILALQRCRRDRVPRS
jgi:hypothetical protein